MVLVGLLEQTDARYAQKMRLPQLVMETHARVMPDMARRMVVRRVLHAQQALTNRLRKMLLALLVLLDTQGQPLGLFQRPPHVRCALQAGKARATAAAQMDVLLVILATTNRQRAMQHVQYALQTVLTVATIHQGYVLLATAAPV